VKKEKGGKEGEKRGARSVGKPPAIYINLFATSATTIAGEGEGKKRKKKNT